MLRRKCKTKDCNQTWEITPKSQTWIYCSIECSCYDGAFSVTKGWLIDPKTIEPNQGYEYDLGRHSSQNP